MKHIRELISRSNNAPPPFSRNPPPFPGGPSQPSGRNRLNSVFGWNQSSPQQASTINQDAWKLSQRLSLISQVSSAHMMSQMIEKDQLTFETKVICRLSLHR